MKRVDYNKPLALALVLVLAANPALAQDLSPVSDMLDTIITALTGPIGRGVAVLALVAAGFAMFFGRLNWPWFLAILFGVVLVFSAEAIVDGFGTTAP